MESPSVYSGCKVCFGLITLWAAGVLNNFSDDELSAIEADAYVHTTAHEKGEYAYTPPISLTI